MHRLRCSEACGDFPDQGSNLCLLHCQADSLPGKLLGFLPLSCVLRPETVVWMFPFLHLHVQEPKRDCTEILVPIVWVVRERLQMRFWPSQAWPVGGQERPGVLGPAAATLCPVQGCWPRIGALCSDWPLGGVLAASGPQEPLGDGASEARLGGCPGPHWLQGASS